MSLRLQNCEDFLFRKDDTLIDTAGFTKKFRFIFVCLLDWPACLPDLGLLITYGV